MPSSIGTIQQNALLRKFLKFAGVGLIGTAGHYAVLAILFEYGGVGAIASSSSGFVVGAAINYILNYHLTFRSTLSHRAAAPKFFAIAAVGFALNGGVMALLASTVGLHYLAAQVVATATTLAWNFLANNFWTFRERNLGS